MRAIPSPTWSTVPTSSSSDAVLKLDNCSLNIADTSAGFTSAIFYFMIKEFGFRFFAYLKFFNEWVFIEEPVQFHDLRAHAGIILFVAYANDEPTDYILVHFFDQFHLRLSAFLHNFQYFLTELLIQT